MNWYFVGLVLLNLICLIHHPLDRIAQQRATKLLGVIFTGKLSFEDHVDYVMTTGHKYTR